jgi:REP element-mobilizing transposase RayT
VSCQIPPEGIHERSGTDSKRDLLENQQTVRDIFFVEIGVDEDHVHFLVQSVPTIPPGRIVQIVKSITAREIYRQNPDVKKILWDGQIWTAGYYVNTVGTYANEEVIRTYVEKQGKRYQKLYSAQLSFLDGLD